MTPLNVEIFGAGKPVVLVHGWAMHSGIWRSFALQLAQYCRVICVDLPGHGYSPVISPFTLDAISAVLADAVPEQSACWLGWSLGATVVLDFAHRYPERVSSLVLMAGNPCFTRPGTSVYSDWPAMNACILEKFATDLFANTPATLLRFLSLQVHGLDHPKSVLADLKAAVKHSPAPDPTALAGGLAILQNADLRSELAGLAMPVMAILGHRDTLVPIAVADALVPLQPALQVRRLEKAAHAPFLSHPETVITLLTDFLNQS